MADLAPQPGILRDGGAGARDALGQAQTVLNVTTVNAASQLSINSEGRKATYSGGAVGLVLAASTTDFFTIYGSATKTVRVTRIAINGISTTAAIVDVQLLLRSTANTSGTSTVPTAQQHDSLDGAATATLAAYTANPTLGTGTATIIRVAKLGFPVASVAASVGQLVWNFGTNNAEAIRLRGTAQGLCLNLNGLTVTGGAADIDVEWTESVD